MNTLAAKSSISPSTPPCINTVSFSKLDLYNTCPQKFYQKYVSLEGKSADQKETALIQGNLAHSILEGFLAGETKINALASALPVWLDSVCNLPIATDIKDMQAGKGIHTPSLLHYAETVAPLLIRCAPNYEGEDAIRKNDGTPPSDPLNYPPRNFSNALNQLGTHPLQQTLDVTAQRLHPDFVTNAISLSKVAAKAYFYALNFTYPDYFARTLEIELSVMSDSVRVEILPGIMWRGYIDWIFKDRDGKITITDHKTNKDCPTELKVGNHDQLNIYACLYYQIKGIWPDYIGINHLGSNSLIRIPTNPETATSIYNYYKELTQDIVDPHQRWLRKSPSAYSNPCVKLIKGQAVSCPLLDSCWKHFKVDF